MEVLFAVRVKVKEKKGDEEKKVGTQYDCVSPVFPRPPVAPGLISITNVCPLIVCFPLTWQTFKEYLLCALFWAGNIEYNRTESLSHIPYSIIQEVKEREACFLA